MISSILFDQLNAVEIEFIRVILHFNKYKNKLSNHSQRCVCGTSFNPLESMKSTRSLVHKTISFIRDLIVQQQNVKICFVLFTVVLSPIVMNSELTLDIFFKRLSTEYCRSGELCYFMTITYISGSLKCFLEECNLHFEFWGLLVLLEGSMLGTWEIFDSVFMKNSNLLFAIFQDF